MSRVKSTKSLAGETPAEELADRLHSAAIHLLRRLRREDEVAGIGPARLSALSVIVFAGPVTMGELARAEQVKPPTMTRIVNGLEKDGLARRVTDAHDGRAVRIVATPRGRRLLLAGKKRRVEVLGHHIRALSPSELRILTRATGLLESIVRDWKAR